MKENVNEKVIRGTKGGIALAIYIVLVLAAIALIIAGIALSSGYDTPPAMALAIVGFILIVLLIIGLNGFKVLAPNEAIVLTFFGKYYGTLKDDGFYYVNPLCSAVNPAASFGALGRRKISLKAMTLNNENQKVNDEEGNPIEIGVVVIWRVVDTAKAVFAVENYVQKVVPTEIGGLYARLYLFAAHDALYKVAVILLTVLFVERSLYLDFAIFHFCLLYLDFLRDISRASCFVLPSESAFLYL